MRVTSDVLNEDRSRDVRLEHISNMPDISVTFDVSNEDRSRDVRPEQLLNMLLISFTFDVPNDVKFKVVSAPQSKNMWLILRVLKSLIPLRSTDFSLLFIAPSVQLNIYAALSGRYTLFLAEYQ